MLACTLKLTPPVSRVANIELEHIHPRGWAMECSICPSPDEAKFGCKINCESHGCKKAVHATCANDLGLLEEAKDDDDMANPYFTHCKQHGAGGDPQLNKWARWVRQKHKLLSRLPSTSTPSPETILRKRNDPRTFLEDAYVDMKSRQEGEIRTLLHDIAKLEAELADTEIELPKAEEEVERLEEDIKTGRHDVVKNREATESLRKNLVAVKGAFKGLPDGLDDGLRTKIIEMFVQGGDSLVLDPEHAAAFFDVYEDTIKNAPKRVESRNRRMRKSSSPPASASGRKLKQAAPTESRHHPYAKLAEKKEQSPAAPPSNRMNVVVGLCSICKTFESSPGGGGGAKAEEGVNGGSSGGGGKRGVGANRLAQCVECERLYHFGCLDPPLVKPLPRGFAWRYVLLRLPVFFRGS
ncbi:PHD finger protein 14 [Rhizophlyctis rosea]|uniref:PHD finger protein 14 n=1 Tax=Rhizophlyctis rosea TaxID=64517 RepID=A0AAD5SFT9_9FUNG|nr:PHD finger protein 14 [Rhizophlyctis rosea]